MKYIQKIISVDEYTYIIDKLEFPTIKQYDGQGSYQNTIEMVSITLEDIEAFFPRRLPLEYHLVETKISKKFREYLKRYIVFHTSCSIKLLKASRISYRSSMTKSRDILREVVPGGKGNTRYDQPSSGYSRNLNEGYGNLGSYFGLGFSKEKFEVNSEIWPFIGYVCIQYRNGHKVFKNADNLTEENKEEIREHALCWKEYINEAPDNIKELNVYLFEREYNVHLITSIATANLEHFNNKENAFKVLSLLSLVSDIHGRAELVDSLSRIPLDIGVPTYVTEDGVTKIFIKDEVIWYRTTVSIILQLAYLIIPVSEMIHSFLYKRSCDIKDDVGKENDDMYINEERIEKLFDDPFATVELSDFDQIRKRINEVCRIRDANPSRDFLLKLNEKEKEGNTEETPMVFRLYPGHESLLAQEKYYEALEAASRADRIEAKELVDFNFEALEKTYLEGLGFYY